MIVALRRALAALALGVALSVGATGAAQAETPTPTPAATATTSVPASPSASGQATSEVTTDEGSVADTPDLAPDSSRQLYALGAAGLLALAMAAVVLLRRR